MGDLILMTRPTGPTFRQPPMGATADILFFTGVRYMRMDDAVAPVAAAPRRRRSDKAKKAAELQRAALTV